MSQNRYWCPSFVCGLSIRHTTNNKVKKETMVCSKCGASYTKKRLLQIWKELENG